MTGPSKDTPANTREPRDAKEVELDFATNILTGFNDEALTTVSLKATVRNRDLRQLQFSGRLRSTPVTAQLVKGDRSANFLALQSQDAGATLRFVDLYRRMHGGVLTLNVTTGDGPQQGILTVQQFTLRGEPALKSIAAQPVAAMAEDRAITAQLKRLEANEVEFERLDAEFGRSATRLEFRDAAMYGGHVGFKATGWIDYARDRADINGTFVPAYGINNAFAQVPLFGPILGGGKNEGLFAVNFHIGGQASAPTLTVNALSAVAPGFLRKILGAVMPTGDGTGAVAPPARSER